MTQPTADATPVLQSWHRQSKQISGMEAYWDSWDGSQLASPGSGAFSPWGAGEGVVPAVGHWAQQGSSRFSHLQRRLAQESPDLLGVPVALHPGHEVVQAADHVRHS